MAVRTDVVVDFSVSPRIVTVLAPSVVITVQDVHDTLRTIEGELWNLKHQKLIDSAGKEALGSGLAVGVTATLQDTQLAFETRASIVSSGTITTENTTGTLLIDSAATFIADGVVRGHVLVNKVDASHSTVIQVDSETQCLTLPLNGGADNEYDIGDGYEIFESVQCVVSGGNLVAVDGVGGEISPIFETFGTQVLVRASTAAALLSADTALLTGLDKLLRNKFITDPVAGTITVFDDDGTTVLFTAPLYEDAAATQLYRGRGAERRERLV